MLTLCELERPEGDSGGHREDFVRGVDEFLTDNYRHPIQLEDVARHMGVSMSGLIHQYRESAATTVGRRLLAIRMDRAAALLTDTGYTLTEIGDLAGIGDAAYLCRCFKRYFNMTPSEYRVSRQG
jgi:AraC-like DNA-binding protein